MKTARLSNVPIKDLLIILTRLSIQSDAVDIIVDIEGNRIILDPVDRIQDDSEITDENIYTLI
jgi:hypothetical protein